ncbi:MAG TPA: DNA-binding protein [Bdellovibrionales bacterium]|nr:DNA-binding protein [Bdellovibrionales bacterium]HCM39031.1 DNA-binding protein [Bdellovibrionales bacterium]
MGKAGPMETAASIEKMIYVICGQKIMLDSDLAELYGVETRVLNQAVRRNMDHFPADFMFELNREEFELLMSQTVISKTDPRGGRQKRPLVFTEQGVAMLSSVLRSKRAVQVNISIVRAFVKLRQILIQEALSDRVAKLEKGSDKLFRIVFQRLDMLERNTPLLPPKRRKIGLSQD